jgi:hypothetical protein
LAQLFGQLNTGQAHFPVVFALVLIEVSEYPNNQLAGRCARVNAQVQDLKEHAAVVELHHQLNYVATQPRQSVDDDYVTLPYCGE